MLLILIVGTTISSINLANNVFLIGNIENHDSVNILIITIDFGSQLTFCQQRNNV